MAFLVHTKMEINALIDKFSTFYYRRNGQQIATFGLPPPHFSFINVKSSRTDVISLLKLGSYANMQVYETVKKRFELVA